MDFRKFFDTTEFTKIATGTANWDYYLMQYQNSTPTVVSIAKDGSGATDSHFGSLSYFRRYLKSDYSKGLVFTDFGKDFAEKLLNGLVK